MPGLRAAVPWAACVGSTGPSAVVRDLSHLPGAVSWWHEQPVESGTSLQWSRAVSGPGRGSGLAHGPGLVSQVQQ